jgi:predicted O-methyltransferase YrrM
MVSGHLQGRFLSMISHMIQPQFVLEIGTFTGYATQCLAEGLKPGGQVYSIELNNEYDHIIEPNLEQAGLRDKITVLYGDALDIIPRLDYQFDLVFIDAAKINYLDYYTLVIDKVNTNGVIIADNVLWGGKVVEASKDEDTESIDRFNKAILADDRVENLLLPIRDGLMICRKI